MTTIDTHTPLNGKTATPAAEACPASLETERIAVAPGEIQFDPHNAKKHTAEAIRILADNIAQLGLINDPLLYRAEGCYRLIAGEGRIRAVLLLGWKTVHVRCLASPPSEQQRRDLALVDNLLQEDLDPLSFGLYCLDEMTRTGRSARELAKVLSNKKDPSTITRCVALATKLPQDLHHCLRSNELPPAVARVLTGLHPNAEKQRHFARLYTSGAVKTGQALAAAIRTDKNGDGQAAGVAGFTCVENGCKITVTLPGEDLAPAETALRNVLKHLRDQGVGRDLKHFTDFLEKMARAAKKASELQQAQDALNAHVKLTPKSEKGESHA